MHSHTVLPSLCLVYYFPLRQFADKFEYVLSDSDYKSLLLHSVSVPAHINGQV